MSQNPEAGNNPIAHAQQRDMQRRTNDLKRAWAKAGETEDVRVISEEIFLRDFLPFFSGQSKPPEAERETLLAYWLQFAGTPFTPVDLHNAQGAVVYRVPPLQDRHAVITSVGNRLSRAQRQADEKALMSPRFGEQIMQNEYKDRAGRFMRSEANPALVKAWQELFAYYGVIKNVAPGTISRTADTSSDFVME